MDFSTFDLHIFDLDDTLINTRCAYQKAQEYSVKNTFPKILPESIDKTLPDLRWICKQFGSGNPAGYMSAYLKSEPELFPQQSGTLEKLISRYQQRFNSELTCFEGVVDYIKVLHSVSRTVAIVSNGYHESQIAKLTRVGINTLFPENLILISGDFPSGLKKPSPYMIEKACIESAIPLEKAVFYGNSIDDILAGNLAGVTTAHFGGSTELPEEIPDIAKPDFTFQEWSRLSVGFGKDDP